MPPLVLPLGMQVSMEFIHLKPVFVSVVHFLLNFVLFQVSSFSMDEIIGDGDKLVCKDWTPDYLPLILSIDFMYEIKSSNIMHFLLENKGNTIIYAQLFFIDVWWAQPFQRACTHTMVGYWSYEVDKS